MSQSTESSLGPNRTGLQTSPLHAKRMRDVPEELDQSGIEDDRQLFMEERREYILESEGLGSIPPPGTLKGILKSTVNVLAGHPPQVFIDKLAERMAFERGGTRLYESVIAKCAATGEMPASGLRDMERIRNEEAEHALLIKECMEQLGADPTAQTPSADLVGMETLGLLQAAADPRTTLVHTLHVALSAELVDNAGWETLVSIANGMGQEEMAARFSTALAEEANHLAIVRQWYETLTLGTAGAQSRDGTAAVL